MDNNPRCDLSRPTTANPPTFANKPVGYTGTASSIINDNGIINLSSYQLSDLECAILRKGLSFCPTPRNLNLGQARKSVERFHRSLHLAYYFNQIDEPATRTGDEGFGHRKFRLPSDWLPPEPPPPALSTFFAANYTAINKLPHLYSKRLNTSNLERDAVQKLASNRDVTIKPADKGSGVVIMNTCDYIHEALRQLADTDFYQSLDRDRTLDLSDRIATVLNNMRTDKEIDKKCFEYLIPSKPRPGRFYLLPKIHKGKLPPPGRPIISAIGSPSEKISEFVDFFLQPLLCSIPSYVKDTGHFVHLINKLGPLPENTILVTLDVTSLYTNIPLPEAERAVARALTRARPGASKPSNTSLLRLLRLVFESNIFTFSDGKKRHYYLQTNGVSMGSKCAPSVACTFMGEFERLHVSNLPDNSPKPLLWLRYIDDIFCIWTHGEPTLLAFTDWLNSLHPRIKFTCTKSSTSVDFLDTKVFFDNDHKLSTDLFIKPTSSLSYLHRTSHHPCHIFTSLPFGEFLRVRRNCSDLTTFDKSADILLEGFISRGYDPQTLQQALIRARNTKRETLLQNYENLVAHHNTTTTSINHENFFLIMDYHPQNKVIRKIMQNNWDIMGSSDKTRDLYHSKLTCGSRRNPRLRDLLVRSSIPIPPSHGKSGKISNRCSTANCKYCENLDTSGQIFSTVLARHFPAKHNVSCRSHNVVYCLTCLICKLQYVGQTKRTFHERLYEHQRNIRQRNVDEPLGRHFCLPGHDSNPNNVKSHILAFITKPSDTNEALNMRLKFERDWIYRLRTSLPHGLNAMDKW